MLPNGKEVVGKSREKRNPLAACGPSSDSMCFVEGPSSP